MFSTLILGTALTLAAPGTKDPPKKDPPTLVGKWVGETGVAGGKPKPPPPGTTIEFTADGKMVMAEDKGPGKEGKYTADPKKAPAELDLMPEDGGPKGGTLAGIYKIEGDTLTIALSMAGSRPDKFESPAGSDILLITLKRAKKE